jgi:hypothetical protein
MKVYLQSLRSVFFSVGKWLFGSLGSSVATFFIFVTILKWSFLDSLLTSFSIYVGVSILIGTIRFCLPFGKKNNVYPNKNPYGEAIGTLAEGFARIHYHRKNKNPNAQNIVDTLVFICTCIKRIFESKTGWKCSVSIKVLTSNVLISDEIKPEAEVITLCRDEDSISRANGKKVIHNIFNNSCFSYILDNIAKPKGKFYINNNLPADKTYRNTSFEVYGEVSDKFETENERTKNWTLPYMSEIVVPITPMIELNRQKNEMIGYLCVDCSPKNAFNTVYDIPMIRGVADGIYDILEAIYTNNYNKN